MNHHALAVDVADFQVGHLRVPGAGGVEGHEQDALARSARRVDELRDFFPAKNRRQATRLFRIGSVGDAPGSAERLDVEEAQSRPVSPYGIRRQLALLEQLGLIFANVSRAQTIGRTAESSSKIFHCPDIVAYGTLRVIKTLELIQHHFSKMGHRDTSCDPHLHQPVEQPTLHYLTRSVRRAAATCKRVYRASPGPSAPPAVGRRSKVMEMYAPIQ